MICSMFLRAYVPRFMVTPGACSFLAEMPWEAPDRFAGELAGLVRSTGS